MVNPLLVALDVPDGDEAMRLAGLLRDQVGGFKIGLELLMGEGPGVVSRLAGLGASVFVDAKLHDIPNTVAKAAERLGMRGARWVTAHATGGAEMLRVASQALAESSAGESGVLAVTVLTSLDDAGLSATGVTRGIGEQVEEMARLAAGCGAEGVVCAVPEVSKVRGLGLGLKVATPGIRQAGGEVGDQRRVATPADAVRAGADLIVVGRPITGSPDPAAAAAGIFEEIRSVVSAAQGNHG